MLKRDLLNNIKKAVIEMNEGEIKQICREALEGDISAYEIMTEGLLEGMEQVELLFENQEYYLPEVLMSLDTFNKGVEVVKPHIVENSNADTTRVVIGVVEGDSHDIGKNIVKIMMQSKSIEVYDLGRDVLLSRFIEKAEEVDAHAIGMSTLMTTTMEGMKIVIDKLKESNIRDKYKVMVGGAPLTEEYASSIGADIYEKDASCAIKKLIELLKLKEE